MDQTNKFNTGAEYALSVLSGKWKAVIVFLLAGHPWRTGELRKQLGISQKVLSEQLQDLIAAGIVERHSLPVIPPHVDIQCTEKMHELGLDGLCVVTKRHLNHWKQELVRKK